MPPRSGARAVARTRAAGRRWSSRSSCATQRVRARPFSARQALVRHVTREDVPEGKLVLARPSSRLTARRDELSFLELPQVWIERVVVVDEHGDRAAPEDAADHRRLLQRVASRAAAAGRSAPRARPAPCPAGRCLVNSVGERSSGPSLADDAARRRSAAAGSPRGRRGCPRHARGSAPRVVVAEPVDVEQVRDELLSRRRRPSGLRNTDEKLRLPPPQVGRDAGQLRASRADEEERAVARGRQAPRAGRAGRCPPSGCRRPRSTSGSRSASAERSARQARCSSMRNAGRIEPLRTRHFPSRARE